jgi:hypothetical protein
VDPSLENTNLVLRPSSPPFQQSKPSPEKLPKRLFEGGACRLTGGVAKATLSMRQRWLSTVTFDNQ